MTNLPHLMTNLENYLKPEYEPTPDDFLRARQRTTGSSEVKFSSEKFQWHLIDLGGQFSERSKWKHYLGPTEELEDVKTKHPFAFIAFLAANEFDIKSDEDPTKTKFEFALDVICKV